MTITLDKVDQLIQRARKEGNKDLLKRGLLAKVLLAKKSESEKKRK